MRQSSTYRAARRNDLNTVSGRRLAKDFERREGSKGKSVAPTHVLFVPPVRENRKLAEGENRYKRMVIPATREEDEIKSVGPVRDFQESVA